MRETHQLCPDVSISSLPLIRLDALRPPVFFRRMHSMFSGRNHVWIEFTTLP